MSKTAAVRRKRPRAKAPKAAAAKPRSANGTKLHVAPVLSADALRHDLGISPHELGEARRALAAVRAD